MQVYKVTSVQKTRDFPTRLMIFYFHSTLSPTIRSLFIWFDIQFTFVYIYMWIFQGWESMLHRSVYQATKEVIS